VNTVMKYVSFPLLVCYKALIGSYLPTFREIIGTIFKGDAVSCPLKMGPTGLSETSVTNYQSTLGNMPEE
jgi:hypothetical protein